MWPWIYVSYAHIEQILPADPIASTANSLTVIDFSVLIVKNVVKQLISVGK